MNNDKLAKMEKVMIVYGPKPAKKIMKTKPTQSLDIDGLAKDYTVIKNDKIRSKICELMSEMLDNPDEHGIYPTSKFMSKMEDYCISLQSEELK